MRVLKGIFSTALVAVIFSSGFYARHQLEPVFETVEHINDGKERMQTAAAKLWPF